VQALPASVEHLLVVSGVPFIFPEVSAAIPVARCCNRECVHAACLCVCVRVYCPYAFVSPEVSAAIPVARCCNRECVHAACLCVCVCVCVHACTAHVLSFPLSPDVPAATPVACCCNRECMHACLCACVYVCVHACAVIACVPVPVYVRVCVCVCAGLSTFLRCLP